MTDNVTDDAIDDAIESQTIQRLAYALEHRNDPDREAALARVALAAQQAREWAGSGEASQALDVLNLDLDLPRPILTMRKATSWHLDPKPRYGIRLERRTRYTLEPKRTPADLATFRRTAACLIALVTVSGVLGVLGMSDIATMLSLATMMLSGVWLWKATHPRDARSIDAYLLKSWLGPATIEKMGNGDIPDLREFAWDVAGLEVEPTAYSLGYEMRDIHADLHERARSINAFVRDNDDVHANAAVYRARRGLDSRKQ